MYHVTYNNNINNNNNVYYYFIIIVVVVSTTTTIIKNNDIDFRFNHQSSFFGGDEVSVSAAESHLTFKVKEKKKLPAAHLNT